MPGNQALKGSEFEENQVTNQPQRRRYDQPPAQYNNIY
jgi:hypothetical protein